MSEDMKLNNTEAVSSFEYWGLLKRIVPYIKPFWGRAIFAILVAIPVGLLDGIVAFALRPYMDYVIGKQDLHFTFLNHEIYISYIKLAIIIPFGIVLFAFIQGLLKYINSYMTTWASTKITNELKSKLFDKLVYMDTKFYDINSSGVVLSRFLTDPDGASTALIEFTKAFMMNGFAAAALIGVMLYNAWRLALVGVIVLGIAFIPMFLLRKKMKEISNKTMVLGGDITTNFNETFSGNKVLSSYNLQPRQISMFNSQLKESFSLKMSLAKRIGWLSPSMYVISALGVAIVMGYGTYLIVTNKMTAGAFMSFITSLLLLYKPAKNFGDTLAAVQLLFVCMSRVFELFDLSPKITDNKNATIMPPLKNTINFNNVTFEYNENQPVLKNINLEIKKGETIAIVGNSGGGKTTLVNLLPRFYDIKSGEITFDNKNIRDFTLKSLRDNISIVFQDNFLFSGTIKENILMGKYDATEKELNDAIISAHLQEILEDLPDGIDTVLGERGTTLSGGQRQRVAIARAMIKNTEIVILDEATSALDNESEAIVQKALDNLIKDKTVFVIAHRLSTIKNANRIAVINEGELVEIGTHEELMNIENGQYKHLYNMQFKNQEI